MHTKVLESYLTPLNAFVKRIHLLVVDNAFSRAADHLTKKPNIKHEKPCYSLVNDAQETLKTVWSIAIVLAPPHTQVEGKFFLLKTHVLWK